MAFTLSNISQLLLTDFSACLCHFGAMNKVTRSVFATSTLAFALSAASARAEAIDCIAASSSVAVTADLPLCDDLYPESASNPEPNRWSIGITAGYGERDNPLINADDDAIYGFLHLSYFGDRFFFDNGDFGWSLKSTPTWSANLIGGIGGERSFFSFFDDGGGFGPGFAPEDFVGIGQPLTTEESAAIEAPDRKRSIDAGVEVIYQAQRSEIMLQLLTDISDRHNGQEAWFSWALPVSHKRWDIVPSAGVVWKSAKNTDYYFGVRKSEAQRGLPEYQADDSFNPFLRLSLSYTLSSHWKIVSVFRYEKLHDEIRHSPSVVEQSVSTAFVGVHYAF